MITKFKLYEAKKESVYNKTDQTGQPLYIKMGGKLWVSEDIVRKFCSKMNYGRAHPDKKLYFGYNSDSNSYNNARFQMDVFFSQVKFGNPGANYGFDWYLNGLSGSFEMYTTGMKRATQQVIDQFVLLLYPYLKHIPNAIKRLREGERILDILGPEYDDEAYDEAEAMGFFSINNRD